MVVLALVGVISCLLLQQPGPQTISLPDASQLTFLKITHGTNHVCRFGNRWQDVLHPILPRKLRAKFPPHVMQFSSGGGGESAMVWLRHDGGAVSGGWPPAFFIAVVDANGLESPLLHSANVTRTLSSSAAPALPVAPSQISGWELRNFPRRAAQFEIRVYLRGPTGRVVRIGEFVSHNPHPGKFPIWTGETLPAARNTNELEISLIKLETGLTGKETGHGPAGENAKSYSRATFRLKENGRLTEKWSVCDINVSNAAGEVRPVGSYGSRWERGEHKVDFEGALWLEEAAWELAVNFARTADFPPDELWFIKGVGVPRAGELIETRVVTNLSHEELEFLGVSGPQTNLPEGYAGVQPHANLHVRTPHPMDGLRVVLVEARDQDRKLKTSGSTARTSTGGRGITPKEMLHGFAIEIPEDAKSLDLTFAATPVRRVEFMARPVIFESGPETRK